MLAIYIYSHKLLAWFAYRLIDSSIYEEEKEEEEEEEDKRHYDTESATLETNMSHCFGKNLYLKPSPDKIVKLRLVRKQIARATDFAC